MLLVLGAIVLRTEAELATGAGKTRGLLRCVTFLS
jgi:hypothetical protein